jgi:hypothetical protein
MGFYRLRGFGFVGTAIVGRIGFNEQWSYDDWLKNDWGVPGASGSAHVPYTPPSTDMLLAARDKWTTLEEGAALGLVDFSTQLDAATSRVTDLVTQIDVISKSGNIASRFFGRIDLFNKLNAELTRISKLPLQDPNAVLAEQQAASDKRTADALKADADRAAAKATADARAKQTAESIAAAQHAIDAAQRAKAVADAAARAHVQAKAYSMEKSEERRPLLIAAAIAIPVAVAAYAALKKRKK